MAADDQMSSEIPPEVMNRYFMQDGGKARPRTHARREDGPSMDDGAGYSDPYPAPDPDDAPDDKLEEILRNTSMMLERFRSLGNVTVSLESQVAAISEALGISKIKKGGQAQEERGQDKLLKEVDRKLSDLIENGFNAQLSRDFDLLRTENIKVMMDAMDARIRKTSDIGQSFSKNLETVMETATKAAMKWGIIAGVSCSAVFALILFFFSGVI